MSERLSYTEAKSLFLEDGFKEISKMLAAEIALRRCAGKHDSVEHNYQKGAFRKISRALNGETKPIYAKLPTGTGKSQMEVDWAVEMNKMGRRVLIVTSRKGLVSDLAGRIESKQLLDLTSESVVTQYMSGHQQGLERPIVVTTYNSMVNLIKKGVLNPSDFDAVSLDESHNAKSTLRKEIIDLFLKLKIPAIGWTASDILLDGSLEQHGFIKAYEMPLKQAILLGFLSPVSVKHVLIDTVENDIENISSTKKTVASSKNPEVNRSVARIWQEFCTEDPTIVFCSSITQAKEIAEEINNLVPGKAVAISGFTSRKVRSEVKKRLTDPNDPLNVVVNVDVWGEGEDIPAIKNVILVDESYSPKRVIQRVGRGLRKFGQKICQVFEYRYSKSKNSTDHSVSIVSVLEGELVVPKELKQTLESAPASNQLEVEGINGKNAVSIRIIESVQEMYELGTLDSSSNRVSPPEGWLTTHGLMIKYGILVTRTESFKSWMLANVSDEGMTSISRGEDLIYYFDPNFCDALVKEYLRFLEKPDDWLTYSKMLTIMGKKLHFKDKALRRLFVTRVLTSFEDITTLTKIGISNAGTTAYYHPKVFERFIEFYLETPPTNWVSVDDLYLRCAEEYFRSEDHIRMIVKTVEGRLVDQYRGYFLTGTAQEVRYYSPHFVEEVTAYLNGDKDSKKDTEISASEKAPDGWKTKNLIREELKVSYHRITRFFELLEGEDKLREEWGYFQAHTSGGKSSYYYSPTFVESLKVALNNK